MAPSARPARRCRACCRRTRRRSGTAASRPTGRGSRCRRRGGRPARATGGSTRRRRRRDVRPRLADRLEAPAGVPCARRARTPRRARRAGSRRSRSTRDRARRGGRCRRTARSCSPASGPEVLARPRVERERRRVGRAEHPSAGDGDAVRPVVRRGRVPRPPHAARAAVERDDIRLPGLEVDRVADDDGGGREPTEVRSLPADAVAPALGEAADRARRDPGARRRAGAREVTVREGPVRCQNGRRRHGGQCRGERQDLAERGPAHEAGPRAF